ncbi:hypothetical protein I7I51_07391 [Histoplasma capsulatum]|uniref:Uncharacterized protein n=1 Tax=Ajellomyces capsulatus TaxID=5037 RepID=A0A8A1M0M4_AJECA|nr:hypothetical protein I7I51_07391 [Histoplasma capsulatum]
MAGEEEGGNQGLKNQRRQYASIHFLRAGYTALYSLPNDQQLFKQDNLVDPLLHALEFVQLSSMALFLNFEAEFRRSNSLQRSRLISAFESVRAGDGDQVIDPRKSNALLSSSFSYIRSIMART